MNKRQQKKATKKAWHPLTMRVKLRNGKIRNRICRIGGYSHYAKIIHPAINKQVVRTVMASAVYPLCAGHWHDIKNYNETFQLGCMPLYGGKELGNQIKPYC